MIKKNLTNINVLLLGVSLFILIIFIGKMIFDIRTINDEIYQKRVVLETKYLQGLSLNDTIEQIERSKERLEKISNVVLSAENTLEFINDLENTATNLNLEQSIKLTEFEPPTAITPIPLQLTVQGDYVNILKYINLLDNKSYYINIYKISLNSQNGAVMASLQANIYWQ